MAKSSTQRILDRRKQFRMIICGQGIQRKRRIEQLNLENGRVEELKLIKHDETLKELEKSWRMSDWAAGLHNTVDEARYSDAPERLWL